MSQRTQQTWAKEYESAERSLDEFLRSERAAQAVKAGDMAPAFHLRDGGAKSVSSDRLRQKGPLVVLFYRRAWCSCCAMALAAIEQALPEFADLGATVLAISSHRPAQPIHDGDTLLRLGDPRNEVAAKFGLRRKLPERLIAAYKKLGINMSGFNDDESRTLSMPALYVINKEGMVIYSEVHSDYATRVDPRGALMVLGAHKRR